MCLFRMLSTTTLVKFVMLILLVSNVLFAQPASLGWTGQAVIPVDTFLKASLWQPNSDTIGDRISVSSDSGALNLHWWFGSGNRQKWVQCYIVLNQPISLSNSDIFGIDVRGSTCQANRGIELKFEDGTNQAAMTWDDFTRMPRWCERLSALKTQFGSYANVDWSAIKTISLAVKCADASADSGIVSFKSLMCASVTSWPRSTALEFVAPSAARDRIRDTAISAIISRQRASGLLCTWVEDSSSWLYGQGLALKALTINGTWANSQPIDTCAKSARRLARFLASAQQNRGYWPRAWHSYTGQVKQLLEADSTIWQGDFPWAIIGLESYLKVSGDDSVRSAIGKAVGFLDSLIDANGKFSTINPITNKKKDVESSEAYAAAIQSLFEVGDTIRANKMLAYLASNSWDPALMYWKESITSNRPVLYANTWLSPLFSKQGDTLKATEALSFVGKVLFTKGPGSPWGFDGSGPIATWYEGTLSYISAGGPGSQILFDTLANHINPDGTVPAYNDDLGSMAGIWAVKWPSLDATAWLYFAAAGISPFTTNNVQVVHARIPADISMHNSRYLLETDSRGNIMYSIGKRESVSLLIFDIRGKFLESLINSIQPAGAYIVKAPINTISAGHYIVELKAGDRSIVKGIVIGR